MKIQFLVRLLIFFWTACGIKKRKHNCFKNKFILSNKMKILNVWQKFFIHWNKSAHSFGIVTLLRVGIYMKRCAITRQIHYNNSIITNHSYISITKIIIRNSHSIIFSEWWNVFLFFFSNKINTIETRKNIYRNVSSSSLHFA